VLGEVSRDQQQQEGIYQSCDKRLDLYSDSGVLSRLINTDQMFSSYFGRWRGIAKKTQERGHAWWGSNLPNDIAARLGPVVQEREASVGDEIGEAHVVGWCRIVYGLGWDGYCCGL
jgi:hypothetical protein